MSTPIPIACPALPGTAGYASAASSDAGQDSQTSSMQGAKARQLNVSGARADDTAKVDGIPGPDRRLDQQPQQPKQRANPGMDRRPQGWPLTMHSAASATRTYSTPGVRHDMKM